MSLSLARLLQAQTNSLYRGSLGTSVKRVLKETKQTVEKKRKLTESEEIIQLKGKIRKLEQKSEKTLKNMEKGIEGVDQRLFFNKAEQEQILERLVSLNCIQSFRFLKPFSIYNSKPLSIRIEFKSTSPWLKNRFCKSQQLDSVNAGCVAIIIDANSSGQDCTIEDDHQHTFCDLDYEWSRLRDLLNQARHLMELRYQQLWNKQLVRAQMLLVEEDTEKDDSEDSDSEDSDDSDDYAPISEPDKCSSEENSASSSEEDHESQEDHE